jgi:GNAT superfamily N-acetyltransferase
MTLEITPVTTRADLRQFIRLPFSIYRNEPKWVAPLTVDVKKRLDRKRNPFFRHAEAEYFIARRDGQPVGRISAHVDHHLNEVQENRWGLFGFFECEPSAETAAALMRAAEDWLAVRGCDRIVGPMDFSTNDECGLLIEGHDLKPIILAPWQPVYYADLLDGYGMTKAVDLLMWSLWVTGRDRVHPAIWEAAAQAETEHGIRFRSFRKREIENEVRRFLDVYNAAWERNWGSVPLTDAEAQFYAKSLKPILDENWAYIAETADGEVVGAALTLPDYNQVLEHLNGRLLPLGWAKALWYRRKINAVRVFALGVKPEYQHTGIAAKFYEMHFDAAARTPQTGGEMGWILETNTAMNRAMEGMGGEIVRRYRIYEKTIETEAPSTDEVAAAASA